ncbi:LAMI_0G07910g1_1 [Lachancea mirantina]|uniref:LAMI_0G07910g1_1 n=1 Tax=Lachancea mirantina TaxID=1230905 RepID=A0A1G4K9T3_9SACH|nr:LAMI_0G07910g1_1 [Lachancea mirantina]
MLILRRKTAGAVLLISLIALSVWVFRLSSKDSLRERIYGEIFDAIKAAKPVDPPKDRLAFRLNGCDMQGVGVNRGDQIDRAVFENLDRCYTLTEPYFRGLQQPHMEFLEFLQESLDFEPESPVFDHLFPREEGIITVGGGRFSLLTYSMIKVLREHNTTLPVEVIIPPQDEGDNDYCNNVLPALNAKCVYFRDVLPKSLLKDWKFERYQIKAVALLISSFKKVLYIDADNFPLKNLDGIFESNVFEENGLVLWPDLWRRMTAPVFYRIANVEVDFLKRVRSLGDDVSPPSRYSAFAPDEMYNKKSVPFHDLLGTVPDSASESGQLLVDKTRHFQTLLLALYYNVYGPEWYYSLFSQGTAGEGDKETFAVAAHVLRRKYYQVKTKLSFDGYWTKGPSFHGVALLQYDCVNDYELYQKAKETVKREKKKYSLYDPNYDSELSFYKSLMRPTSDVPIDVMFAHASFHKFDPWGLYKEGVYLNEDGTQFRSFLSLQKLNWFDIELFNFRLLDQSLCGKSPIDFKYLRDKYNDPEWPRMCKYVKDRVSYLEDSHDEAIKKP